MTDPTDLGDIAVVGQRRLPGGSFPSRGGGNSPNVPVLPKDPAEPGLEPDTVWHPCQDPETALEWNADAAAAEAAREFARRAATRNPPENLNTREWGAYLYRTQDGSIRVGAINFGPAFSAGGVGSVSLIEDGAQTDIVGFVHSHSSGNHLPSDGNSSEPRDIQVLDAIIRNTGNPSLRMYIVAPNQGPADYLPYNQINVYNKSNARSARDSFTLGPEVDPEGQPCA